MKTKIFALPVALALIALVLVSGCVGQAPVEVESNDGLKIIQFTAEPSSVDVGETVLFTLQVQNVGGVTAENIQVWLSGVEGQWRIDNRVVGPTDNEKTLRNLNPPNPTYNQPGDIDMAYWSLKTPEQPKGFVKPLAITAWVGYKYYTTGNVIFKVLDQDHFRTAYSRVGKTPAGPAVSNTNAPIKILVPDSMASYYMVINGNSNQKQTRPVQFKLVNVGSGFPIGGGKPGRIYGTITIRGPNVHFKDCLGKTNTTTVSITETNVDYAKLNMAKGESTISCTIEFDENPGIVDDTVSIDFNLNYDYYISAETGVTVSSYE